MKPALFSNALSRFNRQNPGLITACATSLGLTEYVIDAASIAEPAQLDTLLMHAATAGTDTLLVNGGDGTLDLLIARLRTDALMAWNPSIILLRGGTTNMTHRDVGYGKNPLLALASAMRREHPWVVTERDVIRLTGGDLAIPHYGFFFGSHAIPKAIHHARRTLHTRGMVGAVGEAFMVLQTLGALLRGRISGHPILSPTSLQFTMHGASREASHVFVIATTLRRLVLGMRAARPYRQMGCVAIMAPGEGIWRHIPSLWRGTPERAEGALLRWCDTAITLAFDGEVTLDGELFTCTRDAPMTLTLGPPVRFLT